MMDGKCNGDNAGNFEGEEGYDFCAPLKANDISCRKRVKQPGKVSSDPSLVGPCLVPRRLRSAFNKRNSERRHHSSNGTQLCDNFNPQRVKLNTLDEVTKDEEEVAETLTSLANFIIVSGPVNTKEDGNLLEENSKTKAASSVLLEAPEEEGPKFLVGFNGSRSSILSSSVEESPKTMKSDSLKQSTAASVSQKFDAETPLVDSMNFSKPKGTSLQYFPINGVLQRTQLDALLVQKQDMRPWLLGPASMEHDLQSLKQKYMCIDDNQKAPVVHPGLHGRGPELLTMPSTSKAAAHPDSVTVSRSSNGLPIKKKTRSSYRCHKANQSKAEEQTRFGMPTSNERSMLDTRNQMLQDERLLQIQQAAAVSAAYAKQKQGYDLLSSSNVGDRKSSEVGTKFSGNLQVSYPPNQNVLPFTFTRGSYASHYQEQLAMGATKQVQLQQLPQYIASHQLYGHHATITKQQQQQLMMMWQANFHTYGPKLQQNGRQHDSSSSPLVNQPPSIFPIPADYSLHSLHQPFIFPIPASSSLSFSSSTSKQKQMISNAETFR